MLAISRATAYFESRAWDVEYLGEVASYDLLCTQGGRNMHVEVKGTTSHAEKVLLTRNEVAHARGTDAELALFVLAELALESGEEPIASGGTEFVFYPGSFTT